MTVTDLRVEYVDEGPCWRASTSAPRVRPREPLLPEDFDELQERRLPQRRRPERVRRAGPRPRRGQPRCSAGWPTSRRPPPSRSTCTSTGSASPPTCTASATPRCDWMLERAAEGQVFAAGHGEAGNDLPAAAVLDARPSGSTAAGRSPATRSSAACRRCGPTSASTPWTPATPSNPQIVHALPAPRHAAATASRRPGTRSACGPRSPTTRSSTARSSPTSTSRSCARPASPAPGCSRSASSPGRCSASPRVYSAIAQRAFDDTVTQHARAHVGRADPLDGVPPGGPARHRRDAHRSSRRIDAYLDRVADDWVERRRPRRWSGRSRSWPAKYDVVNRAWAVVDTRLRPHGRRPASSSAPLEQLFRDARLGRIHPGNSLLTHELVGKMSLGINPDEQPRWG